MNPDTAHTVVIIDDHDIVRFGLETTILGSSGLRLVGSAATLADGLELIRLHRPDLAITDMSLPDSAGTRTIRAVVDAQDGRHTLVVSMQDEILYGEAALCAGAQGYLQKEHARANVVAAATAVLAGEQWTSPALTSRLLDRLLHRKRVDETSLEFPLTLRELEVLEQLKTGKSTKQIAASLGISVRTVDLYRASIKRKLRLRTGAEVIAYAFHNL